MTLITLAVCIGCHRPHAEPTTQHASATPAPETRNPDPGTRNPTSQPAMSAELAQFLKDAEETPQARLDGAFQYFAAALPEQVSETDYHDFVRQLSDSDPNLRANGVCGVAAAKQPASLDHLLVALRTEDDPFNRTMIVWCLRLYKDDPRTAAALEEYLYHAKDIDFQRCRPPNGRIVYIRFPAPMAGAAFEAFKALLAIKGKDYMTRGEGWRKFAERFEKNVDPCPCNEINTARFRSQPDESSFDVNQEAQRLIDEFRKQK